MMIRVCKDCGFEKLQGGCASCNNSCPMCGGDIEKKDYVKYMKMKELKKKDGNENLSA